MSVRSSPSTENKRSVPFWGILPSETWQTLGPAFLLGDCPLLAAPTIPISLGWCPSSTFLNWSHRGLSLTLGQKCRRLGCQAAPGEGEPRSGPTPGFLALCGTRGGDAGRARPRADEALASAREGLGAPPPHQPRETERLSVLQPVPRSLPRAPAPGRPVAFAAAGSRPPGAPRPVDPPAPAARPPRGPHAAGPGSGRPPPACRCPRQCPAPRGPARP